MLGTTCVIAHTITDPHEGNLESEIFGKKKDEMWTVNVYHFFIRKLGATLNVEYGSRLDNVLCIYNGIPWALKIFLKNTLENVYCVLLRRQNTKLYV